MKCKTITLIRSSKPRRQTKGRLLVGQLKINDQLVRGRVVFRGPSAAKD